MSVITTTDTKHDPKFCPPAAALNVVGLKAGDVKSDDALFSLYKNNTAVAEHAENQNSVAIFILTQRGYTYEQLVKKLGESESTYKRHATVGMAILRTGEVTRTTAAVRKGQLSKAVVDEATKGTGSKESKIVALEQAALAQELKRFVFEDGSEIGDKIKTDVLHARLTQVVENDAMPLTAGNLAAYLPSLSEDLGIKVKPRSTEPDGGTGPQGMEFHMKACLKDLRAIAEAADAPYEPTSQDIAALLTLMEFIGLSDIVADVAAQVEAGV